jgi:transposase-like protein
MPKRRRRSFTPQYKAQVVLEVLAGLKSQAEVARQHKLKPELIAHWKDVAPAKKPPWPKPRAEQVPAVRSTLSTSGAGMTPNNSPGRSSVPRPSASLNCSKLSSLYQAHEWTTTIVLRCVLGKKPLDE